MQKLTRLGRAIREARHQRGWTLIETARAVGVSFPVLQGYETARIEPTASRLFAIARVLGMDLGAVQRVVDRRKAA